SAPGDRGGRWPAARASPLPRSPSSPPSSGRSPSRHICGCGRPATVGGRDPARSWHARSGLPWASSASSAARCRSFAGSAAARALVEATVIDGSHYAGIGHDAWSSLLTRPTVELVKGVVRVEPMWPFVAAIGILVPLSLLRPTACAAVAWLWLISSYVVVVVGP